MRFEMPVAFGPTDIPDVSHWGRVEMASTSFTTTAEAVRPLVPGVLDLPDRPVVSVSRMTYDDVDYLAGRGYNEVTVGITCTHPTAGRGSFSPVVWVDEVRPILIGREFMGYAKLGADLPPVTRGSDSLSWTSTEYGAPLMAGRLTGLAPLEGDDLEAVRRAGAAVSIF
ncbi:MAG: hypothetical protein JWL64_2144, partial [Frankiales bacterium]|nr:hypothetical protein [Frankiales bacterium]